MTSKIHLTPIKYLLKRLQCSNQYHYKNIIENFVSKSSFESFTFLLFHFQILFFLVLNTHNCFNTSSLSRPFLESTQGSLDVYPLLRLFRRFFSRLDEEGFSLSHRYPQGRSLDESDESRCSGGSESSKAYIPSVKTSPRVRFTTSKSVFIHPSIILQKMLVRRSKSWLLLHPPRNLFGLRNLHFLVKKDN